MRSQCLLCNMHKYVALCVGLLTQPAQACSQMCAVLRYILTCNVIITLIRMGSLAGCREHVQLCGAGTVHVDRLLP